MQERRVEAHLDISICRSDSVHWSANVRSFLNLCGVGKIDKHWWIVVPHHKNGHLNGHTGQLGGSQITGRHSHL